MLLKLLKSKKKKIKELITSAFGCQKKKKNNVDTRAYELRKIVYESSTLTVNVKIRPFGGGGGA